LPANEHALVRVRVTYVGAEEGPVTVTPADFGLIGTGNVRYTQAALVPPEPVVDARLYRGGAVEGWLAFELQRNDADLLLIAQEAGDPSAEVRFLTLPAPSEAPAAEETPAA
jgi:hypothetical protein